MSLSGRRGAAEWEGRGWWVGQGSFWEGDSDMGARGVKPSIALATARP